MVSLFTDLRNQEGSSGLSRLFSLFGYFAQDKPNKPDQPVIVGSAFGLSSISLILLIFSPCFRLRAPNAAIDLPRLSPAWSVELPTSYRRVGAA